MTPRFWLITANIELDGGSYSQTSQVPSFILDGDIQGIVNAKHAQDIARDMLLQVAMSRIGAERVTVHTAATPLNLNDDLRAAARNVIATWARGDLANAVNELEAELD